MTATGALLPLDTTAKLLRQPPDVQHLMPDGLLLCLGCTHKHRARKGPMQACCCQWGCDSHKAPLHSAQLHDSTCVSHIGALQPGAAACASVSLV